MAVTTSILWSAISISPVQTTSPTFTLAAQEKSQVVIAVTMGATDLAGATLTLAWVMQTLNAKTGLWQVCTRGGWKGGVGAVAPAIKYSCNVFPGASMRLLLTPSRAVVVTGVASMTV